MRRLRLCAALALAALLIPVNAAASEAPMPVSQAVACWTSPEDGFYHLDRACGDVPEARYPLSVCAAEAFDRAPCPNCASGVLPVAVWERLGTCVVRIPRLLVERADLLPARGAPVSLSPEDAPEGADALRQAALSPSDGLLAMNIRCIGDFWYLALRRETEGPILWRAEALTAGATADGARVWRLEAAADFAESVVPVNRDDATRYFHQIYGELDISVYREEEANIAVLHAPAGGAQTLSGRMLIDGLPTGINVTGSVNRMGQGSFCFVLTDGEMEALRSGATLALDMDEE